MFLGLNYGGLHDSSIVLLDQHGTVKFAASEERYSRIKKDGRFPSRALQQISLEQVQQVGVPYLSNRQFPQSADPLFANTLLANHQAASEQSSFPQDWHDKLGSLQKPLHYVDHHDAHAIAGFFLSGYSSALVITCDGGALNCAWNMGYYSATAEGVTPLHRASHDHYFPLCSLYSDMTAVLGYRPNVHEGKLTGLAAYAPDSLECEEAVWNAYANLRRNGLMLSQFVGGMQDKHSATQLPNGYVTQKVRQELSQYSDAEIAHAVQRLTEKKLLELTQKVLASGDYENVVLAGGIFANVKVNLEIKRLGFKNIFVCPPMGDEGVALGAAISARSQALNCGIQHQPVTHLFWGTSPAPQAARAVADLQVQASPTATPKKIASLLADGKIVVRVTGEMEFGPRALGHRTILCQPTDPTVNDWLNKKLRRTEFMPFAPVVLAERAKDLFIESDLSGAEHTASFMTICMACKPRFQTLCPAVVHVDGTARPQFVTAENQPDLYQILIEYEKLTGLPALINTSFNVHDEPIVASAKDAIVAFFQSQLDYLALDDQLISLEENPVWSTAVKSCESPLLADQKHLLTATSKQLGRYTHELEEAKAWLESQLVNWQAEATNCQSIIQEQKAWISELETGKAWLEQQWQNWQQLAASKASFPSSNKRTA